MYVVRCQYGCRILRSERESCGWFFFSLGRVLAALPPHLPTIISTGSCRLIGLITSFRFIIPMTASERSESRRTRKRFIESKITSRENLARKNLNDTNMVSSTGVCWWCRWYRAPILCSWLMRFAVKKSAKKKLLTVQLGLCILLKWFWNDYWAIILLYIN